MKKSFIVGSPVRNEKKESSSGGKLFPPTINVEEEKEKGSPANQKSESGGKLFIPGIIESKNE